MIKNSTRRLIAVVQSAQQFAAHSLDGFQANLGINGVFELLTAARLRFSGNADTDSFIPHGGIEVMNGGIVAKYLTASHNHLKRLCLQVAIGFDPTQLHQTSLQCAYNTLKHDEKHCNFVAVFRGKPCQS